jgi:hypothetical protein
MSPPFSCGERTFVWMSVTTAVCIENSSLLLSGRFDTRLEVISGRRMPFKSLNSAALPVLAMCL